MVISRIINTISSHLIVKQMFTKCVDSSHMHVKFDNISSYVPKDVSNKSSDPIFKAHQYLDLFNKYFFKLKVT